MQKAGSALHTTMCFTCNHLQMIDNGLQVDIFPEIFPSTSDLDARKWPLPTPTVGARFPHFVHYMLK